MLQTVRGDRSLSLRLPPGVAPPLGL